MSYFQFLHFPVRGILLFANILSLLFSWQYKENILDKVFNLILLKNIFLFVNDSITKKIEYGLIKQKSHVSDFTLIFK